MSRRAVPEIAMRVVGILEIALASLLAVACIGLAWQMLFPGANPPADQGGWAAYGFALLTPICLAFAIGGATLMSRIRGRWAFQLLPALAVSCVLVFFT